MVLTQGRTTVSSDLKQSITLSPPRQGPEGLTENDVFPTTLSRKKFSKGELGIAGQAPPIPRGRGAGANPVVTENGILRIK